MRAALQALAWAAATAAPSDEWSPPRRSHTKAALAASTCTDASSSSAGLQCEAGDAPAALLLAGRRCAIDRVPWGSLTAAEFAEQYVSTGRPLILTDASTGFLRRPADWVTKAGFVAAFGALDVNVGTGAELAQFGGKNLFDNPTLTLGEVVAGFEKAEGSEKEDASDSGRAVFDMRVTRQAALADSFAQPDIFSETFMGIKGASWNMLSLGGDGSGLVNTPAIRPLLVLSRAVAGDLLGFQAFHTHADTWLGLAAASSQAIL